MYIYHTFKGERSQIFEHDIVHYRGKIKNMNDIEDLTNLIARKIIY